MVERGKKTRITKSAVTPKIRVLHVLGGLSQGGVENFLMNIYRETDRTRIRFDFLVNRKGFFDAEVQKMGGNVYYIPALQTVGQLRYRNNLDKFFKQHSGKYDIVHSHLNQVTGIILEIAKKNDVRIRIAHAHNNGSSSNPLVRLYKECYLRPKINKNANCFMACSADAARYMFKKNADDAIIIQNGIPLKKFAFSETKRERFRKEYGIKPNDFVIGHIGRFEEQKNHSFVIDIYREIKKQLPESRLFLLGEGSLKERIRQKCEEYGISESVSFLKNTEGTDYFYCGIDAFLFPSLFEGLGIVLIEAQTAGLYCYTSKDVVPDVTRISDKIHYISLSSTSDEWAKEVLKDRLKTTKTKTTCRSSIHNNPFDITMTVDRLERCYNELMESDLK